MAARQALIADIQKFSVNDGPGFRTAVFLKGCSMRCTWCHNPETIAFDKQVFWRSRLCAQCGTCLKACSYGAINAPVPIEESRAEGSTYRKIDRAKCVNCMECVKVCPYNALQASGKLMTIEEIMNVVEQDQPFYENSGGGLTLSGGEPTAFPEFSLELLREAKRRGLHVCMDTNGHCDWKVMESLIPNIDIVLFDIKHLDDQRHRELTGVTNKKVLRNIEKLATKNVDVWVRVPVIPGVSHDFEYQRKVAKYLSSLAGKLSRVDIIPYHNWCQNKYEWLGLNWSYKIAESLERADVESYLALYLEAGLNATIGGSGFENRAIDKHG